MNNLEENAPLKNLAGSSPHKTAVNRCQQQIDWYANHAKKFRKRQGRANILTIILAGMTPVLVVIQASLQEYQRGQALLTFLIALFPATAAMISATSESAQWKENYIRFAYTAELLRSELVKFQTRTSQAYKYELTEEKVLDNFVTRIEKIALAETGNWQAQITESMEVSDAITYMNELRNSLYPVGHSQ